MARVGVPAGAGVPAARSAPQHARPCPGTAGGSGRRLLMPDTDLAPAPADLDPRRYFERVAAGDSVAKTPPVCLYLEVTNRCNLLCETCPRTFEALEPPADMSWELFTRIIDQVPGVVRVARDA